MPAGERVADPRERTARVSGLPWQADAQVAERSGRARGRRRVADEFHGGRLWQASMWAGSLHGWHVVGALAMKLLVDGYNLLHASGVFGSAVDPPTLETSRRALLGFLAQQLSAKDRKQATVVFDGKDAPPGLPSQSSYEQITVLFSRRKATADELIAEMIAAEPQPKQLLVVSSDHGVQRAARQRGIVSQDSEAWIRDLRRRAAAPLAAIEKTEQSQSAEEVALWVKEFSPAPSSKPASAKQSRQAKLKKK